MPPAPVSVTSREPRAAAQQRRQLGQVGLATHERRRRGGEVPARAQLGRLDRERRVLPEDRALQLVQRGAGLEPQLLSQRVPRLPEHRERVGLPVAPVEGEHQLPAEPLAAPVLGDQRFELCDQIAMAPEREVGVDPVLERRQPQLLQPRHLGLRERFVADVLVGLAAPQPERLAEARLRRAGLAPRQLGAAACDQELEPLEVQLTGREAEPVAGPVLLDPLRAEAPAQPVDVDLQRVDRRRGRLLTPQRVDQPVARDDVPARDQQAREQRHLLARRQLDGAGGGGDLHGSEHPELHGRILCSRGPLRKPAQVACRGACSDLAAEPWRSRCWCPWRSRSCCSHRRRSAARSSRRGASCSLRRRIPRRWSRCSPPRCSSRTPASCSSPTA
jgi:hypothetical protein